MFKVQLSPLKRLKWFCLDILRRKEEHVYTHLTTIKKKEPNA